MEYFLLTQSSAIVNPMRLLDMEASVFTPQMTHDDFAKLKKLSIAYIQYSADQEIPDIYKYPTYMVSDPIKKVLAMYDDAISFKGIQVFPVELKDVKKIKERAKTYWVYDCVHVDCLSQDTVFLPNGEVEEVILDRKKIKPLDIFRPKGLMENRLVVSLPVAESLLRRNTYGVGIQEILVK